jgi:aryl-alcohol dehydrogenase-like predicted oxidoreductase
MEYRPLGRTGLHVSAIGLGTWAMGGDMWGAADDAQSLAAFGRAYELGVNFFDTADIYGRGHSEELLGAWLKTIPRDKVYIATKAGLLFEHYTPYRRLRRKLAGAAARAGLPAWLSAPQRYLKPADFIKVCEGSLRRLGTDYVDLFQDHIWWNEHVEAFAEACDLLRKAGKIRFFGLSADDVRHIRRFHAVVGGMDALQIDYSILNRAPEREALPFCVEQGIGVIARGPLAMGKLSGKLTPATTFAAGDQRRKWTEADRRASFLADLERVEQLRPVAGSRTLAQVALAFVLRHPAVSTTIPGGRNPMQVQENVAAAGQPLSDADLGAIERAAPLR